MANYAATASFLHFTRSLKFGSSQVFERGSTKSRMTIEVIRRRSDYGNAVGRHLAVYVSRERFWDWPEVIIKEWCWFSTLHLLYSPRNLYHAINCLRDTVCSTACDPNCAGACQKYGDGTCDSTCKTGYGWTSYNCLGQYSNKIISQLLPSCVFCYTIRIVWWTRHCRTSLSTLS